MDLEDIRLRETIDLQDRARNLREDIIPELEDRITEARESDDPDHSSDELESLKDQLEGQARACDRVSDALGGSAFILQELMAAETAKLEDDVVEQSVDIDYQRETATGSPKTGYHKIRTLELSIIDAPDEMPSERDRELGRDVYRVGQLPQHVSDYLYECAVSLNDAGTVDGVGNLSSYGVTSFRN